MKKLIGILPQQLLTLIDDSLVGEDLNNNLKARFGRLRTEEFSTIPFVDAPEPEPVPGKIWSPGYGWTAEAVTRTWTQEDAPPMSPAEAMAAARSAMADILDALSLADRMKLQPLRVQVEAALNLGQVDLAYYIVTNATVEAHLLPVRAQIVALFPQS